MQVLVTILGHFFLSKLGKIALITLVFTSITYMLDGYLSDFFQNLSNNIDTGGLGEFFVYLDYTMGLSLILSTLISYIITAIATHIYSHYLKQAFS